MSINGILRPLSHISANTVLLFSGNGQHWIIYTSLAQPLWLSSNLSKSESLRSTELVSLAVVTRAIVTFIVVGVTVRAYDWFHGYIWSVNNLSDTSTDDLIII